MSTTNFFELLEKTSIEHVNIDVTFSEDRNTVTIATITTPKVSKDKALNSLKPIVITNTLENITKGFFPTVEHEMKQRQTMYTNIETLEADREAKAKETALGKQKKEKYKKTFENLENLVKDDTFNAKDPKMKKKVDEMIKTILEIKPNCSKTKDIKKEVEEQATQGELFQNS